MWAKRTKDLIVAFVVGNGVLDSIAPRRRAFLWVFGPIGLRKPLLWLADHPTLTRTLSLQSRRIVAPDGHSVLGSCVPARCWGLLPFWLLRLYRPNRESRRADSNR